MTPHLLMLLMQDIKGEMIMKNVKSYRTKKMFVMLTMICVLALTAALGIYFGFIKNNTSLKLVPVSYSYVIDIDNPSEISGHVDLVFVGRVEKQKDVVYENIFDRETENGTKTTGTPYTNYDITVLENLKGNLKSNETVPILKEGGVSMDGKHLILGEGDFMPKKGDVCVFFISVQEDGTLLLPGKNFSVKIMESSLTEQAIQKKSFTQVQQEAENERMEIVKSDVYQKMLAACKNEIPYERERYAVPAELIEK